MINFFPQARVIASSASVESNFNNVKHRVFRNTSLPLRVDDFLKILIQSTDGAVKLAEAAMMEVEAQVIIIMHVANV